jgi:hypothetical protein
LPSVIPSVDVEAVSAGIEWAGIEWAGIERDQLPVPCAPDIHEQVGRRGHGIRAPLRNLMHAVEQGHGPTTENSAWAPEHIGDDSPDARAHLRHEQTNRLTWPFEYCSEGVYGEVCELACVLAEIRVYVHIDPLGGDIILRHLCTWVDGGRCRTAWLCLEFSGEHGRHTSIAAAFLCSHFLKMFGAKVMLFHHGPRRLCKCCTQEQFRWQWAELRPIARWIGQQVGDTG